MPEFNTNLSVWTNTMTNLVKKDYTMNGVEMDEYSTTCAMNAMSGIYSLVTTSGTDIGEIPTDGLRDIVAECASLKLNANTIPKEIFFNIRKKNVNGTWIPTVELGLSVNAYLSMLRNFGANVKTVYDAWLVKEGDDFVYPARKGIKITDPEWNPKGLSLKTIRAVVPVELNDGRVTYLIAERDSVMANLMAHIKQNLLNEMFGICADRYKANDTQKAQIAAEKEKILSQLRACKSLEEMLNLEVVKKYASGAWSDTTESMIDTKLVGNAIRKFPKDFNVMASRSLTEIDETYRQAQEEIDENANSVPIEDAKAEVIDAEYKEVN